MSYLEQYTKTIAEVAKGSAGTEPLYYGLLTSFGRSLAIIADELHDLNRKQSVLYLCDGEKCESCSSECHYTTDLQHAANFNLKDGVFIEGRTKWPDNTNET